MKTITLLLLLTLIPHYSAAYTNSELRGLYTKSQQAKDPAEKSRLRKLIIEDAPDSAYGTMCLVSELKLTTKVEPLMEIKMYTKAIKLDQTIPQAYINRGNAWRKWGNQQKAMDDYNKAVQVKPDYARAYGARGDAYRQLGDGGKSLADYNKSVALDATDHITLFNRATLHYYLKNYPRSAADFSAVIKLKPDYGDAYAYRCAVYKLLSQPKKAKQDCATAAELGGKGPQ